MIKFAAGFATCWYFIKYKPQITETLYNFADKLDHRNGGLS